MEDLLTVRVREIIPLQECLEVYSENLVFALAFIVEVGVFYAF